MRKGISQEVGKKTIVISFLSQFFQYGVTILVLPAVLSQLAAADMGVWYIFLSITSMIKLLDFGFAPSIQRNIAYVAAGAKELKVDGYVITDQNSGIDDRLMSSLIQTSKFIYRRISVAVLLLSLSLGSVYLFYALKDSFSVEVLVIWIVYSFGVTFDLYFSYILSLLRGMGFISEFNINIIISKTIYILLLYVLIYFNFGLMSLVIATFANVVIMVALGFFELYRKVDKFKEWFHTKKYENLFHILWKNARNSGLVGVGVFLLSQSGVLISGIFLNVTEVAQLGLILQLYGILVVLARVYLTTYTPQISSLWVSGDIGKIQKVFLKCQLVGYLIYISGVMVIYFMGNTILSQIIHSNVLLPSGSVILLYGFFYMMEITHGNCCSLIGTSNNIPFVNASIVSGLISIVFTLIFIMFNMGMISFPLALICGSLPYNSWKWPYEAYLLLKVK